MSAMRCPGERSSICGKALRASARYRGSVVVVNTFIAANSGTTTPFTCPSSVSEPTILTTHVSCANSSGISTPPQTARSRSAPTNEQSYPMPIVMPLIFPGQHGVWYRVRYRAASVTSCRAMNVTPAAVSGGNGSGIASTAACNASSATSAGPGLASLSRASATAASVPWPKSPSTSSIAPSLFRPRCSTLTGSPLFPLLNTMDVHSSDSVLLGIPLEPELRGRRHVAGERGCGHDGRTRQVALAADAHAVLPVAVERRDRALPLL